ncbi:hypothetical protein N7495_004075 [Penicillium taxi]|uniref:uncharacterized protein n=1 Tax=Penicillium taxi TaxID=168475 RepID=UPI0025453C0B|nr:uncharacterized protein N7495_004075 [Penicillium taxi]KAJ5899331.1 hypothetical protein N7495_004075 [Penicillium taxi]
MHTRPPRRPRRSLYLPDDTSESEANVSTRTTRKTHSATAQIQVPQAQAPVSTDELRRSPRIILKMPAGKLREATGSRSGLEPKKKLVEIQTSDDDLEDQEEDEVDDEDAEADEDIEMDDAPSQPPPKRSTKVAAPARGKAAKTVEEKEIELEDDEEEGDDDEEDDEDHLSVTDSDAEGEPDDQDEGAIPEANVDELEEEDDDDMDEDMDSDVNAMGSGKTTKRQRGNLGNDFLQLPMEPQVKKHLTAEERAMRRAEMARRRKNLSEKRNEEEKMDTINRLLKRQPPKKRGRQAAATAEGVETTPADQEPAEALKADPTMVRWVSNASGSTLNVPLEWLGTPAGRLFGANGSGKMVEEVL